MAAAAQAKPAPESAPGELIEDGQRAYRFSTVAPLPGEVQRVARGRLAHAIEALAVTRGAGAEAAIHETRKDMKKLRALLRLVRDDLGGKAYRRENARFRDAARRLSGVRDADVMRATLAGLRKSYPTELTAASARLLGKELTRHRRELARQGGSSGRAMGEVAEELRAADAEVAQWPLRGDGWGALRRGLERSYRGGREGLELVRREPSGENVHEWRKRVKDLWYHLSLLEELWPAVIAAQAEEAHELSALLGDDHDLVVLGEFAAANGADRMPGLERFGELIERRRGELAGEALVIGERLFAERPKAFVARHERLWGAARQARENGAPA